MRWECGTVIPHCAIGRPATAHGASRCWRQRRDWVPSGHLVSGQWTPWPFLAVNRWCRGSLRHPLSGPLAEPGRPWRSARSTWGAGGSSESSESGWAPVGFRRTLSGAPLAAGGCSSRPGLVNLHRFFPTSKPPTPALSRPLQQKAQRLLQGDSPPAPLKPHSLLLHASSTKERCRLLSSPTILTACASSSSTLILISAQNDLQLRQRRG